jgi:PhnB protein
MTRNVKPVPEGFRTVTPHLMVQDVAQAIDFYQRAFGAKEIVRMNGPEGKVTHAQITIGDSNILLGPAPSIGNLRSPESLGGSTVSIFLYLDNVDSIFDQAVSAGAQATQPLADMFWGDRYGLLTDPSGHRWAITTHKEDLTPEQIDKRSMEFFSKNPMKGKS